MFDRAVDGNLAALAKYEAENDKQEQAWEDIKSKIEAILLEIEDLATQAHEFDNYYEYDFTEEIAQEIKDVIQS